MSVDGKMTEPHRRHSVRVWPGLAAARLGHVFLLPVGFVEQDARLISGLKLSVATRACIDDRDHPPRTDEVQAGIDLISRADAEHVDWVQIFGGVAPKRDV